MSKKEDKRETGLRGYGTVPPQGRLLALDLGRKRVGVAVTDEQRLAVRPLEALQRRSWKELLRAVSALVRSFDAQALVVGLPLMMDGTEGEAAMEARRLARNFHLSLSLPVFLQDERLTSREAESRLRDEGRRGQDLREQVDSRAASIILLDFISDLASPDG